MIIKRTCRFTHVSTVPGGGPEMLVSFSLVSAIIFHRMNYVGPRQSYTTKHFISLITRRAASSCLHSEITSSWLCAGGIRCVARGCSRWSIPPPGLPSSALWSQTVRRTEMCMFINKANGIRSRCQCRLSSLEESLILIRKVLVLCKDGFMFCIHY